VTQLPPVSFASVQKGPGTFIAKNDDLPPGLIARGFSERANNW